MQYAACSGRSSRALSNLPEGAREAATTSSSCLDRLRHHHGLAGRLRSPSYQPPPAGPFPPSWQWDDRAVNSTLEALRDRLVAGGTTELELPRGHVSFTGEPEPDALINDLAGHPHAFVLAALTDRQVDAKIAWRLPQRVAERVGSFEIADLAKLSAADWLRTIREPSPLHRFCETMAIVLRAGVERIVTQYDGDAGQIWANNPPSKAVVDRLAAFHGAGPKISTMAANILVRYFHIPMSDYRHIDISADVQVCRVMGRLGFVPEDPSTETVVRVARKLHPNFPGIFDLAVWDIGRTVCRPTDPKCEKCSLNDLCAYANGNDATHALASGLDSMAEALTKLAALRDGGLITAAEYETKKTEWLAKL
jgi:endonuclease III